jgi:hypothetical protein
LQGHDLGIDGRLRDVVALLRDDHGLGPAPETVRQALEVILTLIVVLVEDSDLGVRPFFQDVSGVDAGFGLVVGLPSHRPRKVLRIVPFRRTGRHEKLRHVLFIQIAMDRRIVRRTQGIEDQENLIVLDKLAGLFDGFWRARESLHWKRS